jgi:oligosaccharide repeat unit polymerase
MNNLEFYNLVYENLILYIFILFGVSIFFFFIGKRYTNTWLDPLRITLLSVVFTFVVPVFLYATKIIDFEITTYFVFAQFSFWMSFILFAKKKINFSKYQLVDEKKIAYIFFLIFLIIYIISISLTYLILGIPLLKESRLDTFTGSGLGILARIMPFSQIYCIFYSFYAWPKFKKYGFNKLLVIFSFFIFLTTGILSGSRSSFFIFLFIYWGYCYFYLNNTNKITKNYKYLLVGLVISIFSFVLKSDTTDILTGLSSFGLRVISSGDNYYMALPNDIWKQVQTGPWFQHLFNGLFGPLRIINSGLVPPPVGFQLTWLVNPSLVGQSTGPLSSPALLGFLYFRWGGIVFAFILGAFVSILIYRLPSILPKGILSSIFFTYLYIQIPSFIQDAALGMSILFDVFLNLFILVFLISIILKFSYINSQTVES